MQARRSSRRRIRVKKEGVTVHPEVMIPLVGFPEGTAEPGEDGARHLAAKVFAETGVRLEYLVGTMIEVPRACVAADEISKTAEFFSFAPNDLTPDLRWASAATTTGDWLHRLHRPETGEDIHWPTRSPPSTRRAWAR